MRILQRFVILMTALTNGRWPGCCEQPGHSS